MDPLNKLNKETDSSYLLAVEAIKRGYNVMHSTPGDLSIDQKKLSVTAGMLCLKKNILKKEKSYEDVQISKFDVVLIRQDPPFNMNYITNTYFFNILKTKNRKPFFINSPEGIRNYSEKIYPLLFKNLIPNTTITCKKKVIYKFLEKYKKIVIKPLFEKGGKGVILIDLETKNIINVLSKKTKGFKQPLILQKFLEKVKEGDKRILLIDGEPAGCVNRVPKKGSFIANLHLGSFAKKTSLSKKEILICKRLKPSLKRNGLFFVGIDVIGEKLTEINVTSPTGIKQINDLSNKKIEKEFWDKVEEKIC